MHLQFLRIQDMSALHWQAQGRLSGRFFMALMRELMGLGFPHTMCEASLPALSLPSEEFVPDFL